MRKIRVCHIASGDLWAGAEALIATLLEGLAKKQGIEVFAVVYNQGKLADILRSAGIETRVIDEKKNPLPKLFLKTVRFLEHTRADIVHTHRYKENIIGALAARICRIQRVVRTQHGLPEPFTGLKKTKMKLYLLLDLLVARILTNKVILVSKNMRSYFLPKFGKSKLLTIHNGIKFNIAYTNSDSRSIRAELGIPPGDSIIGTVGRLVPVKGYDRLLRVAKYILEQDTSVTFLVVGNGPLRRKLEELAGELNIEAKVIFTGFRDDIPSLLGIMDIFVMSSIYEGIPMSLLESMTLSKPVVSTRVGGIPEVIREGIDGLLVDPADEKALSDACLDLLRNPERARQMGANAKTRSFQEFSQEAMVDAFARQYLSLAGSKARRSSKQ